MSDSSDDYTEQSYTDSSEDSEEIDLTGIIIKSRYLLVLKIGHGAFSTVWLSYRLDTRNFCAIKVQDVDEYDAGLNEVEILLKINKVKCPNFNKLIDNFVFDTEDGYHICMVFDLLAGSIFDLIKHGKYSKGLDPKIVKNIVRQVLVAMARLNDDLRLLHTDIKPENVLLEGTSVRVQKIIDQFNNYDYRKLVKKYSKKKNKSNGVPPSIQAVNEIISKLDLKIDKDELPIDEKYFMGDNIRIKLSDFGGCYEISDKMDNHIQTRYYMAPEIILYHPFSETCDIWSIGCMTFELLTGDILFDPDKTPRFSRDRHHLNDIQSILGLVPKKMIDSSEKKMHFFRKNGLIKGKNELVYTPMSSLLINKLGDRVDSKEIADILDFLYKTLELDPEKRPRAIDCINHSWLK